MFKFPTIGHSAAEKGAVEEDASWEPPAREAHARVGTEDVPVIRCHALTFHESVRESSDAAAATTTLRVPTSNRLSELPADGCMDAGERAALGLSPGVRPRHLPLGTYNVSARVSVPLVLLRKSDFFRERFDGPWKGKREVLVTFPTVRCLDAFLLALEALAEPEPQEVDAREEGQAVVAVQQHNQFELFAVGAVLRMRGLVQLAEAFIAAHLDTTNFMLAVQAAAHFDAFGASLLSKCFCWLKRTGLGECLPDGSTPEASAWWESPPVYDAATQELLVGKERCSANAFDGVAEALKQSKAHFFDGSHALALPPTPVRPLANGKPGAGFPDMTRCYLERRREMGPERDMTHFLVFTEDENKLLLAACSNMEQATFVLSANEDFEKYGEHYVGFTSANFLGTHFTLYDHGMAAAEMPGAALPHLRRREHCMVVYKSNVLGRVPNSMRVVLGGAGGNEAVPEGGLEARLESGAPGGVSLLHTRQPRWNAELDAWTMDFKGRVKLASKKNFQLINSDEPDKVLMLFGKVTKNRFTLDFRPPMTVTKALHVALSTFADKLAVT
eukprot:g6740.t1